MVFFVCKCPFTSVCRALLLLSRDLLTPACRIPLSLYFLRVFLPFIAVLLLRCNCVFGFLFYVSEYCQRGPIVSHVPFWFSGVS